jgi:Squalene-hopene cyclase C-terminal domain/Prenyltransferase and squalene oxidase repeat
VTWELATYLILAAVLLGGFAWYERSRPSSQVVALVAVLAALAVAGRLAFAALPNVVATTDIVIFAGFALGAAPGFAVGALAGLVSNFWLGQGPWTPWQMAGWGLCGILGAALAVVRPRPSRVTLAVVCALAGVGYGALLNFSLMATYGGELSLQRFLALEARAVPFDAAHAIGNATLALLAGPAMVRALVRFRERFEWRAPAVASVLLLALALVAGVLPGRAEAGTASAATWLVSVENSDGGWGSSPGSASSPSVTAWAMLGLEAAGRNPLDVSSGGKTGVDYLRGEVGSLSSCGDFARTILALEGAGVDPRSFGGKNLVSALAKRRRGDGSFEGWPATTAFAIVALRSAGGGVDSSVSWLAGAQNGDGGWGDEPGLPSTADDTGAAMQAIPGSDAARHGLAYLKQAQRPNGGFALGGSGGVNSQSTAWAVQGMIAVGADPASVTSGGTSPLEYLASLQQPDGHYRYSSSSDQTPVWVTGEVLVATAGDAFPVPAAPRLPQPQPRATAPRPSGSTHAGSGSAPALPSVPPAVAESLRHGGSGPTAPPGGSTGASPPSKGIPSIPLPGGVAPGGGEPSSAAPRPAARPFKASDSAGPKPWAPLVAGFGSAGIALASVLLLGRRFGW